MGTLFSLFLAAYLFFYPLPTEALLALPGLGLLMISFSLLTGLVFFLLKGMAWAPLQKGEQNLSPRLLETAKKDKKLLFLYGLIAFLCFGGCFLAFQLLFFVFGPLLLSWPHGSFFWAFLWTLFIAFLIE